jgi:alkylhydroperoxidase family enzyme
VSRIAPPSDAALPPAIREIVAGEIREHGAPLNTTKVWARHPALFEAYRAFRTAMQQTALIPLTLRYLVYVRVASLNGCPF